ncbi:type I polyketide synthase [Parapedobacter tibetensis]|uniref:type I polyketide synthase n=1 Tax=Parapedobacter tibetensis TaxID=2972951 RepID=UPI00214DAAFD|nr:type I polyketide synthase [Parapedobacter tibetensis]
MKKGVDIAIVGMAGIFPGAGDVEAFWRNIRQGKDAIQTVPEHRMETCFFGNDGPAVDRFYCRRGGFIDDFVQFDPIPFGLLPVAVAGTEPEHLLMLSLAKTALEDADVGDQAPYLDRTAIIIGKGNYAGPGATRAIEIVRTGEQIIQLLRTLLPDMDEETLLRAKREFQQKKGRFAADTAMGLIPNMVASLVANRLNLGGAAYTVDAACASSLIAVDHAVRELRSGHADMVLAGGMHVSQNAPFWSIFTQLGALSRDQQIRPFDQRADGLLIGEGCGVVVLRRLEDAQLAGQRIYAVIKGVGVSSDGAGTSVMSPSIKGQQKAIEEAWQHAGMDRSDIGYLEAHGTGTPLGDKTELETLNILFSKATDEPKAGIGTIKSMIGHTMPAAGIAGLIKMALALHHKLLPPTLHCEEPLPALKESCFEPIRQARSWPESGLPLVAGVNAFGFGGINAHVVLEAFDHPNDIPAFPMQDKARLLARSSAASLIKALEEGQQDLGHGDYRIALFDPSPERIQKAIKIVQRGKPWRNRQDIWFSNEPLLTRGGKIAFLFPGLDALAGGEVESLVTYFDLPLGEATNKQGNGEGVFGTAIEVLERSRIIDSALKLLGVVPDLNAGHSLGEWLAGRASGLATEASVANLLQRLNPDSFEQLHTRFLAVGAGADTLLPLLQNTPDVYLAIDNCPQQVILCGTNEAVDQFVAVLRQKQIFHQSMPFQSGFHSPFMHEQLDYLMLGMNQMEFRKLTTPLWSATTLTTYPDDNEAIKELSIAHLVKPVRFRELIAKLYREEEVRCFIQVGSGGLVGFVDDTLKGKNYSAIAANSPHRRGLDQLKRVLAALFVEGKNTDLTLLGIEPPRTAQQSTSITLQLGSPFVKELDTLKGRANVPKYALPYDTYTQLGTVHPLVDAYVANINELQEAQATIIQRLKTSVTSPQKLKSVVRELDISLQNTPYLTDHALIRQREGWPHPEDTDPVIPMTMILELFAEMGESLSEEGQMVHKIKQIKVHKWLNVANPFRDTLKATKDDNGHTVSVILSDYASASVDLSTRYEEVPLYTTEIGATLPITITPEQIYTHHMFHGLAYQGIQQVLSVGQGGIRGIIVGAAGKGSLLDNAGQLFGLWLQLTLDQDKVAFPVKIDEVQFYADRHDQQGNFTCTCLSTQLNDEFASADIIIEKSGHLWAYIRGWQNRRLEIDERLWNVSMDPLNNLLSEEIAPGVCFFHNAYQRVVSWDFIIKRYLNQTEKKQVKSLNPRKQRERIISRVAAKDAVRLAMRNGGAEACYPIELEIASNPYGKPMVVGHGPADGVEVSLSHKNKDSVAIARFGIPVGIDMEEILERDEGFANMVFTVSEKKLLAGRDLAEWYTRFWVAKEAYGKYLGMGLKGNPKAYEVSDIEGFNLTINQTIIHTISYKNYIIGWTL